MLSPRVGVRVQVFCRAEVKIGVRVPQNKDLASLVVSKTIECFMDQTAARHLCMCVCELCLDSCIENDAV